MTLTALISPVARAGLVALSLSVLSPIAFGATKAAPKDKPAVAHKAESSLVKVEGGWVRATVKGQTGTGGFMDLTASQAVTLVGFSTPVAPEAELHEMVMDGSVMRMRSVESLNLPAGQTVSLRPGPGGHHLMLMGLKQPLVSGSEVTLTLKLRLADGKLVTQDVVVPVRGGSMTMGGPMSASDAASGMSHRHGMHHEMHHQGQ